MSNPTEQSRLLKSLGISEDAEEIVLNREQIIELANSKSDLIKLMPRLSPGTIFQITDEFKSKGSVFNALRSKSDGEASPASESFPPRRPLVDEELHETVISLVKSPDISKARAAGSLLSEVGGGENGVQVIREQMEKRLPKLQALGYNTSYTYEESEDTLNFFHLNRYYQNLITTLGSIGGERALDVVADWLIRESETARDEGVIQIRNNIFTKPRMSPELVAKIEHNLESLIPDYPKTYNKYVNVLKEFRQGWVYWRDDIDGHPNDPWISRSWGWVDA